MFVIYRFCHEAHWNGYYGNDNEKNDSEVKVMHIRDDSRSGIFLSTAWSWVSKFPDEANQANQKSAH